MRSKHIITGMILLAFIGCGKSPEKLMEMADEHIQAGEFELAIDSYNTILQNHTTDSLAPEAEYKLSRLYLDRLNDYDAGWSLLEAIPGKYPDSRIVSMAEADMNYFPEWLKNVSESQRNKKEIQKSIRTLEYLIQHYPEHDISPKSQYLIGDIYMNDLRDFAKAIDSYRKVVTDFEGTGQDAHAQFMIGYIYANVLHDGEKATDTYREFLNRFPNHELVPSVKFELEYLGMDINEIPVLKHIAGDEPALP